MFETLKFKGLIINCRPVRIEDHKKGEVTQLTEINYVIPAPTTDDFSGGAIFVGYSNGKAYELIKSKVLRLVDLEITQKPTKNGTKYSVLSVDNVKLK